MIKEMVSKQPSGEGDPGTRKVGNFVPFLQVPFVGHQMQLSYDCA